MKPTSIIFILVSLIVILVGWLVCRSAETTAAADGVDLFASSIDENEDLKNDVSFSDDEIYNKFELVVSEADVYVYGGYPVPHMELYNFDDGSYRMTTANRSVTVDTTIDLMSVVKFWESGFSFHGFRDYFRRGGKATTESSKRINLYLPSDSDVNVIKITLDRGSVYVSNFDTALDITIDIGTGNALISDFKTSSQISAEIDEGSLYMQNVTAGMFDALLTSGDITAESFSFGSLNISGGETNVSLGLVSDIPDFNMNLSARHGDITLYGEDVGSNYTDEVYGDARAFVTVTSGDIIISKNAPEPVVDPDGGAEE